MISKEHRCVFVHIPRTAGTSIEKALGWMGDGVIGPYGTVPHGTQDHRTIGELRAALPPEEFHSYFKFTIVRNPWDRAVSWYKVVIRDPVHLKNFKLSHDCSFRDFMLTPGGIWGLQPQLDWIREADGGIPLDYIGRFEKLQETLDYIRGRLNLPALELPHLIKAQDRTPYPKFYDAELRAIVSERYGEEIELFGYRFGE